MKVTLTLSIVKIKIRLYVNLQKKQKQQLNSGMNDVYIYRTNESIIVQNKYQYSH